MANEQFTPSPDLDSREHRYRIALELVWALHVKQRGHIGYERPSGLEQGCIQCVCALALGRAFGEVSTASLQEQLTTLMGGDKHQAEGRTS